MNEEYLSEFKAHTENTIEQQVIRIETAQKEIDRLTSQLLTEMNL